MVHSSLCTRTHAHARTHTHSFLRNYSVKLHYIPIRKSKIIQLISKTYSLPKLKPEDMTNLKRSITNDETNVVANLLTAKRSPGLDGFTAEFCQILRKD